MRHKRTDTGRSIAHQLARPGHGRNSNTIPPGRNAEFATNPQNTPRPPSPIMQDNVTNLVDRVLTQGLDLHQRINDGYEPDLDTEQAIIKDLLLVDADPAATAHDGLAPAAAGPLADASTGQNGRNPKERFLGVRYALVCWLDELFTCDSPWASKWNEQKLEVELYGTNDRAWKFWEQARYAQARPTNEALEAFYLCVMLGFRGKLRDQPEELHTWIANAKHRLGTVEPKSWPLAEKFEVPTYIPPLRGHQRLRRMVMAGWMVALCLIPFAAFVAVYKLSG